MAAPSDAATASFYTAGADASTGGTVTGTMESLIGLVVAGGFALLSLIFIFVVMGHLRSIELVLRNIDKNLVEAASEAKKRNQP